MTTVAWWTHRPGDPLSTTGLGRYVTGCVGALHRLGHADLDYEIWTGNDRSSSDSPEDGVPVHRLRGPRRALHLAWMTLGWPRIESVSPSRADIVHLAYPAFPVPTRLPLVVTVHDVFPLTHPEWYGAAERRGFALAIERCSQTADVVVVNSRETERELLEAAPACAGRTDVVGAGIDERFFEPVPAVHIAKTRALIGLGEHEPYVLTVGRLNERKNQQVLIDAVAMTDVDLALVMVGPDGDRADQLRARADRVAPGRVVFVGGVSDDRLVALLAGASVVAHPALDEGFGFVPLEAMAAGVPVVASRDGSLTETVADVVTTCPADDPSAWAAAIDEAASNADPTALRVARARARDFTWDAVAARLEGHYRRLSQLS